jgi:hypothetical protein
LDSHRHKPLPPRPIFVARFARAATLGALILSAVLAAGTVGYHALGPMGWIDAFLNASMILGGMGPVGPEIHTVAGKLFAAVYALFSGIMFLAASGVVFAPVIHRFLHRFHLETERDANKE